MFTLLSHVAIQGANTDTGNSAPIDTTGAKILIAQTPSLGGGPTFIDSAGNTWTHLGHYGATGTSTLVYCINPITSAAHTFRATGTFPALAVQAWSCSGTPTFDVENGTATETSATTIQPGSITPSGVNALVVYGIADAFTGSVSVDGGTSNITDQLPLISSTAFAVAMAYKVQTSAVAINPTWSDPSAARKSANIASFLEPQVTNVPVTGVSATGSAGTDTPSLSKTLSGVSATGSAGSVSVSTPASPGVGGVSAAGSAGSVVASVGHSVSISGVSAGGVALPPVAAGPVGIVAGVSAVAIAAPITVTYPRRTDLPVISIMRNRAVAAVGVMGNPGIAVIGKLQASGPEPKSVAIDIVGVSAGGVVLHVSTSNNLLLNITGVSAHAVAGVVTALAANNQVVLPSVQAGAVANAVSVVHT